MESESVMDERLRFVGRLLDGEQMSRVCREFGISRKTGYKIFDRYKDHGLYLSMGDSAHAGQSIPTSFRREAAEETWRAQASALASRRPQEALGRRGAFRGLL